MPITGPKRGVKFSGTHRTRYTPEKIREMRSERKNKKSKLEGYSDEQYLSILGDLIAAGHLKIVGFEEIRTNITNHDQTTSVGVNDLVATIDREVKFKTYHLKGRDGEAPHVTGYLVSGHPKDPYFKINGWINDDGTIRLELAKHFDKK